MLMKRYKFIFFDLDNTLWNFKINSYHALKITFNKFGLDLTSIKFDSFFEKYIKVNDVLWEAYRNKTLSKKELTSKRFDDTFDHFLIKNQDSAKFNEAYLEEMPLHNELEKGALDILDYLHSKNYRLSIITNGFKEVQMKKLTNSGILHFFENIYISEVIKAPKPAKEIFQYALSSSNARKKESIMIGDSWDVDVVGALNYGIDQVFYSPKHDKNHETEEIRINTQFKTNTFYIEKLDQLQQIF